jgi:hypothetical protein
MLAVAGYRRVAEPLRLDGMALTAAAAPVCADQVITGAG